MNASPDKRDSICVLVAALNEEAHLTSAVNEALSAVTEVFDQYEFIIFNDGSTDRTGEIADDLARKNPRTRVVHYPRPRCLGHMFRTGIEMASSTYFILIDGKGFTTRKALEKLFSLKGSEDIVIPYTVNYWHRSHFRRLCSWGFTFMVNRLFGLHVRYYNHSALHKLACLRTISLTTDSYAYQAEALIKLLRRGCTYTEVGVWDNFNPSARTKALSLANLIGILKFFVTLTREVYLTAHRD